MSLSSFFKWLLNPGSSSFTQALKSPAPRRRPKEFPPTYTPIEGDPRISQPKVFDPALQHYPAGYRAGEPQFSDPDIARRWHAARQNAIDHILRSVASLDTPENLVLRGSTLLRAWFPEKARRPGDLDWVVRPAHIKHDSREGKTILSKLIQSIISTPSQTGVKFDPNLITQADIWLYVRAPGKRVVFTWTAQDLPSGQVQLDIVFGEELPTEPHLTSIPCQSGPPAQVWAATKELSLAWKLLWLATDYCVQGKDLYDAAILAQSTPLRYDVLEKVFSLAQQKLPDPPKSIFDAIDAQVEWDSFAQEYPDITGDAQHWRTRLIQALELNP